MTDSEGRTSGREAPDTERSLVDSLKPVAIAIWALRRIIVLALLVTLVVFSVVAGLTYLRQPVVRTVSVAFRPTFDGASVGRYPSGIVYAPSDVISSPVLSTVFDKNRLLRFTSFEMFANSLSVIQAGTAAELLATEYRAKMAAPNLTAVDYARLEEEYRSRARGLQLEYVLTSVSPPSGWGIPTVLMEKALNDVLTTWAQQAVELRGAVSYPQELMTAAGLGFENLHRLDILQRVDVVRAKTRRLITSIAQIQQLPGGGVMRGGPQNLSLPEIRARLEDLLRYRLEPAYGEIRSAGLITNTGSTQRYVAEQLRRAERDAQEATSRKLALEATFKAYTETGDAAATARGAEQSAAPPMASPQLSDSLLDRLMALGRKSEDLGFRQDLTRRIEGESLSAVTFNREVDFYRAVLNSAAGNGANPDEVMASIDQAITTVTESANQTVDLYRRISAHNLNPEGQIYAVTGPFFSRTERALSLKEVFTYLMITLLIVFIVSCAVALVYFFTGVELRSRRPAGHRPGTTSS